MKNRWMERGALAAMLCALAALVPSPALYGLWTPYGIGVALSVLAAMGLMQVLRTAEARKQAGMQAIGVIHRIRVQEYALWCVPAAFVCARLAYCLAQFGFYFMEMGAVSVLRTWEGGFMLYGAALGAALAAASLAKRRGASVAGALDEIAAPGVLSIAICRLFEGVTTEGVGAWVENEALMRFPFAVMNEYEEWQVAVFLLEALVALVIWLAVLRIPQGKGERALTALLLYACCQIVLESLRMDGCIKVGFVRVSQVISAAAVLFVTGIRAYRAGGGRLLGLRAAVVVVCAAAVGVMEWALDKTPVSNVLIYAMMTACCAVLAVNGTRFACKGRTQA